MKNDKDIPLTKVSVHDDLYEVIDKIDHMDHREKSSLMYCLDDKLNSIKKELKLYIKQQVALEISNDILMANIANWLSTNRESELWGKHPILFVEKKSYWSFLVFDYLKKQDVSYKSFHRLNFKRNKTVLFLYHLIKLLVEVTRALFMRNRATNPPEEARIGIPFYVFQNFTNFYLKNYYLFWFYKSGIDPEKILIYVPEAEFKISDEEISNIKKAKFNIVFCPTRLTRKSDGNVPSHMCTFKVIPLLVQYLKQIIKMHKYAKSKFMKEQWKILSLLFVQLPYWEDFFQSNNIKVKFRFHDIFSLREIAAKLSGVITLSYHYSNHSDMTIIHQEICDVFFIWAKRYENYFVSEHSTIRNLIQTGYIFDYTFDYFKDKATKIRDCMKKGNVSYVIALLDENMSSDFGKPMLYCYKRVLEYARTHSDIGIIIKPKKETAEGYLKSSVETAELVSILEMQGRIRILDNKSYPVEAGLASDIVIGMIPDSTAGMECALAGVPMVIYDCTNSKAYHPYYTWGYNKMIFDDIQCLLNLLNKNKERPGSVSGFANWSPIFNLIDPFRDGTANQRIGAYIKNLSLKLDEGLTKKEAIEEANKIYVTEFGLDKVSSLH